MGDPETQPIMMRLRTDFGGFDHCRAGRQSRFGNRPAGTNVLQWVWLLRRGGYPGSYTKGLAISGLDKVKSSRIKVFHAGTAESDTGEVTVGGGRVLCVTRVG